VGQGVGVARVEGGIKATVDPLVAIPNINGGASTPAKAGVMGDSAMATTTKLVEAIDSLALQEDDYKEDDFKEDGKKDDKEDYMEDDDEEGDDKEDDDECDKYPPPVGAKIVAKMKVEITGEKVGEVWCRAKMVEHLRVEGGWANPWDNAFVVEFTDYGGTREEVTGEEIMKVVWELAPYTMIDRPVLGWREVPEPGEGGGSPLRTVGQMKHIFGKFLNGFFGLVSSYISILDRYFLYLKHFSRIE